MVGDPTQVQVDELRAECKALKTRIEELREEISGSSGSQTLEAITPEIKYDGFLWEMETEGILKAIQQDTPDCQCVAIPVNAGDKYKIVTYCIDDTSHPAYGGSMGEDPERLTGYKEMAVPVMAGKHSYFVTVPDGIFYLAANSDAGGDGNLEIYKCVSQ